jgi:hypothetical protein
MTICIRRTVIIIIIIKIKIKIIIKIKIKIILIFTSIFENILFHYDWYPHLGIWMENEWHFRFLTISISNIYQFSFVSQNLRYRLMVDEGIRKKGQFEEGPGRWRARKKKGEEGSEGKRLRARGSAIGNYRVAWPPGPVTAAAVAAASTATATETDSASSTGT